MLQLVGDEYLDGKIFAPCKYCLAIMPSGGFLSPIVLD